MIARTHIPASRAATLCNIGGTPYTERGRFGIMSASMQVFWFTADPNSATCQRCKAIWLRRVAP